MSKKHIGSDFDDFLRKEKLLDAAEATAAKRVIAFEIAQEMRRRGLTKSEMASRMKTSRPALERLLDPANRSVTLATLERAASAVTQRIEVEIPAQLFAAIQSLVDAGWFRSVDDIVLDALRRFLDSHREELMGGLLREDLDWGFHGRD